MNNSILINEDDLKFAQSLHIDITEETSKNKAIANTLAVKIAQEFFNDEGYDVDAKTSLCNISRFSKELDISDIYINGVYIDVRLYFEDGNLCVPKIHFDNNILPAAYMFIKISSDLSEGNVTGFVLPEDINVDAVTENYYFVKEDLLKSFYDISDRIVTQYDTYGVSDADIFYYQEGTLDDKLAFYKSLLMSKSGRERALRILSACNTFEYVSKAFSFDDSEGVVPSEDILSSSYSESENVTEPVYDNEYSTVVTANIEKLEDDAPLDSSEEVFGVEELEFADEEVSESSQSEQEIAEEYVEDSNGESVIEELFSAEDNVEAVQNEAAQESYVPKKKSYSKLILALGLAALIGAGGYAYYNHSLSQPPADNDVPAAAENLSTVSQTDENAQGEDAMPVESVVSQQKENLNEEAAVSVDIPAIEKNLDASVIVSNLRVEWEVPSSYAANAAAKRYLTKLGKIVQLNLKTELLLLSKPPITNKIKVEIKYNDSRKKFDFVSIVTSSGEQSVDDVIKNTLERALNMKLNSSTDGFNKLQGNPVLVINL